MQNRWIGAAALALLFAATPAGASGPVAAPLAVWDFRFEESLICVQVSAGKGAPMRFILDSASTHHVIDEETASRIGLNPNGVFVAVRRSDSSGSAPLTQPVALRIGSTRLEPVSLLVLPLGGPKEDQNRIDGILGLPLFERHLVQIDYRAGKIRLYPPAAGRSLDPASAVPLQIQGGLLGIRLENQPGRSGIFAIDTGFSRAVAISPHAKNEFTPRGRSSPRLLQAGGLMETRSFPQTMWKVGMHRLANLETLVCRSNGNGLLSDRQWDGLVGNPLLSRFRVTFDSAGKRLFLEPADS